ncbi:MAG: glycosyltransferase family 4 protein [Thaumarchaeota archaeon]|nr:glycosyltransferase family 4 protein [Nitrososphaerota archaeon]
MKIAQVNVFFNPYMVGGAEWYVYNVSRQLTLMGHEVHVFTAAGYNGKEAPASEVIEGINVHRFPMTIDWSYRMKVWKGLGEALSAQPFDVIHTYDYAQPHSRVALKVAKKTDTGSTLTVFDVHSMIPRTWYKQFPMKLMEGYLGRGTLVSADKVLVRAPNLIPPLLKLGGEEGKMIVTPSGIRDESLGEFDVKAFRTKYEITGSPIILFLGRLNPLKGPQHLIEAAPSILREFPDAAFVFVGAEQSGYAETLRAQAAKLGVTSAVHFLGPIYDFQEKMQAYASCTVFVLPTTYEGTSQAIFEAMSQAKPVVATNVGGIPYQITDGVDGFLVKYGDPQLLGAKIAELLRDPALAAELGRRAKERVRANRYSILAANLEKIYEGVEAGS